MEGNCLGGDSTGFGLLIVTRGLPDLGRSSNVPRMVKRRRRQRHLCRLDTYYGRLIDAMKSAASECIPRQRKKALAGWSEVVTPYRNKSIFWNKVWVENGMPEVGLIRDIRQSSKKDYKHAAKWVIRNQDNITADRMATKLHSDMNREFWDEVKRVRGNAKDCAGVIDDAVGEDAICDVFASKYEELYSSVSFNADDMVELRRDKHVSILFMHQLLMQMISARSNGIRGGVTWTQG
ncbi:hypothetical protein CAPTEDRAFT_216480 [Capitella teleta]|uniref:Uncharacterized protein n=1 Tax=Capitella teleta TaxID=283909 RepID=R7TDW7_CAPTE|nr:hypothetical protein CAPTEDRAFT_216480 [Capitella teleta]|eukprot:ELT91948.1 hypothetical protein CAPTEDRAFT_216480 [Capitella teleta]